MLRNMRSTRKAGGEVRLGGTGEWIAGPTRELVREITAGVGHDETSGNPR